MSLLLVKQFQHEIYRVLISNRDLSEIIKKIHIGINNENNFPFLSVKISKIDSVINNIYTIYFHVNIYVRDSNFNLLIDIAEIIKDQLIIDNQSINNVIGIKMQDIEFNQAKDLITEQLKLNYISTVKQVNLIE